MVLVLIENILCRFQARRRQSRKQKDKTGRFVVRRPSHRQGAGRGKARSTPFPLSLFRSLYLSLLVSFYLFACFTLCSPDGKIYWLPTILNGRRTRNACRPSQSSFGSAPNVYSSIRRGQQSIATSKVLSLVGCTVLYQENYAASS